MHCCASSAIRWRRQATICPTRSGPSAQEADPRPALLARYRELVRDAEKRAALIFDRRPKAPCEVRREPPFTEKNAAAHYSGPARDGSRPGIFWVPLPGSPYRIVSMRFAHVSRGGAWPSFPNRPPAELEELPRFRRDRVFGGLSAHAEGWALYAEKLAAENKLVRRRQGRRTRPARQ